MSLRILTIGISLLVVGCTTTPELPQIPCPGRPLLEPLSQEQRNSLRDDVYEILAGNQIKLKGYASKLERRAGCET